jgi:acyl carrier protein
MSSPVGSADSVREAVAAAWRDVLERADIGLDDDFYALGGDSLRAVRIVDRVQQTIGVDVSVRAVLECRTVRGMTDRVRAVLAVREG